MLWDIRAKGISTDGIYVPGFSGISAPYWKPGFQDIFIDTGRNPNKIIRAGMESIGFLFNDILKCFSESGIELPKSINASGGAARPVLLQFISSLTNLEICYSDLKDRTAIGVFKILNNEELNDANELNNKKRRFKPKYLVNRIEKEKKWHKTLIDSNLKNSYSEI
jgi:glycerol kinase